MFLFDITGYKGTYGMSAEGTVFRLTGNTGKPLPSPKAVKQHVRKDGYCITHLSKDNVVSTFLSHRLVWATLRGPIPEGAEINHLNGKRDDNRPENLETCTRSHNMLHKFRVLRRRSTTKPRYGVEHHNTTIPAAVVLEMHSLWKSGVTQTLIASRFGVHQTTVSDIVRGKSRVRG